MLEGLKKAVLAENLRLVDEGLVKLTWGNASAIDRTAGLVVIKPSGVPYSTMTASDMVAVSLDGTIVEGTLKPSSDLATHLAIYRAFPSIGGVVHTHSVEATAWAQAGREIVCYGTTHADCFYGHVPITRLLSEDEVSSDYEGNTGKVIVERFQDIDPLSVPGVLVAGHAPFVWGATVAKAVDNAVSLEEIARMARLTEEVRSHEVSQQLPQHVLDKHFLRKHGANAYYGQAKNS